MTSLLLSPPLFWPSRDRFRSRLSMASVPPCRLSTDAKQIDVQIRTSRGIVQSGDVRFTALAKTASRTRRPMRR